MDTRRVLRGALGVVVVGSLVGLVIYADMTDLDAGVQAPLYALITATGLAVALGARADRKWERGLNRLVRAVAVVAGVLSAFQWLLNEDAGTVFEVIGSVGAALAVIAFLVNVNDIAGTTEKPDRCDSGSN